MQNKLLNEEEIIHEALKRTHKAGQENVIEQLLKRTRETSLQNDTLSIEMIIAQVQRELLEKRIDGSHWNFHAHLGLHFISQYILFTEWCGFSSSQVDRHYLRDAVMKSQLADGSWLQIPDANMTTGELNTTIFNYWGLKILGESVDSPKMKMARHFILANGGLEASALFTKIIMALFNNFDWNEIAYTPYVLFVDRMPSNYREFSQWVIPHLMAISYLRCNRVSKNLGKNFDIKELYIRAPSAKSFAKPKKPNLLFDSPLVEKILMNQQPHGSWGGYSLSTLLSNVALQHYGATLKDKGQRLSIATKKGFAFVEKLYFGEGGAYKGALMDGKNWDTILIGNSLMESGLAPEKLRSTFQFVKSIQTPEGGIPYGDDFEYAPDTDDTAEAVLFLSHEPKKYREEIERAVKWILKMQNDDGGWGAFDLNNCGNPLLRSLTKSYNDSVDLFDDSSADITGHVLECLAKAGYNKANSPAVRKAIRYLKSTQDRRSGTWIGRWGVNYIFGTTCALSGLLRIGESAQEPYMKKALSWLMSKQNPDGGFGESVRSYLDFSLAGVGTSTPTQTAWVLSALSSSGLHHTVQANRAAKYLIREYREKGTWFDRCIVGTGHPGLLYMNYPSYAYAFSLLALSQYLEAIRTQSVEVQKTQHASRHSPRVVRDKSQNPTHAGE